jgi:hypothetical protein
MTMNAEARFVMPADDATDDDRWRALEVLSAVPMTIEQLERGNELYSRAQHEAMVAAYEAKELPAEGHRPDDVAFAQLERFCEAEGLQPADIAAHAMLLRYVPVQDAMSGCVNLKVEYPETFASLATGPIDPICMEFDDLDSMPEHLEREWANQPLHDADLPY